MFKVNVIFKRIGNCTNKKDSKFQENSDVMFRKLVELEAKYGILEDEMIKFNVEEDEIKSAMATLNCNPEASKKAPYIPVFPLHLLISYIHELIHGQIFGSTFIVLPKPPTT